MTRAGRIRLEKRRRELVAERPKYTDDQLRRIIDGAVTVSVFQVLQYRARSGRIRLPGVALLRYHLKGAHAKGH